MLYTGIHKPIRNTWKTMNQVQNCILYELRYEKSVGRAMTQSFLLVSSGKKEL